MHEPSLASLGNLSLVAGRANRYGSDFESPTRFGADTMRRSFVMSLIVIAGVAAVPPLDCAEPPGRDG